MKAWKILKYFLAILLSCSIAFLTVYLDRRFMYGHQISELTQQVQELEEQLKPRMEKEQQIKDMTATLQIAYKITKWEAKYYSYIFYDFAEWYDIPWELYPALIRYESNFLTGETSKKKARGIAQVIDTTARIWIRKLDMPSQRRRKGLIWNEILNMTMGFAYLSETIRDSGDVKAGIKVYVGGYDYPRRPSSRSVKEDDDYKYVGDYKTTVFGEFTKLGFLYQGVKARRLEGKLDVHDYWPVLPLKIKEPKKPK